MVRNMNSYNYLVPAMSWLSKKILIGKLRDYFYIEDDKSVQVSLLSKQEIRCSNLVLRTEAINKPTWSILVKHCSIGLLEISFNNKKAERKPLTLKVDQVKLILKFNPHREDAKSQEGKKKQRPVLEEFYKAVGSEEKYQSRTFFQQEIYQLKQLVTEYALGELYLKITNIDISMEYSEKPKYFGIEIQEIEAKQELSYQEKTMESAGSKVKGVNNEHEVHCDIKGLCAYLGTKFEAFGMMSETQTRKLDKVKKKTILNSCTFATQFNMAEHKLSVVSKEIEFKFEDILICELLNLTRISSSYLNDQPLLRPKSGPLVEIRPFEVASPNHPKYTQKVFYVSQGSLLWWQRLGKKIMEKLNRKKNTNILGNSKYRKYLFCLLYRYTYGAHPELEKIVDDYEYFKTDIQILHFNKSIINKISAVRNSSSQASLNPETECFLAFLSSIQNSDRELLKMGLKKINYKDIKNSYIIMNVENCSKFIRMKKTESANSLNVSANVGRCCLSLRRSRFFSFIRNDLLSQSPSSYFRKKKSILEYYCNQTIINNQINHLQIASVLLKMNSSEKQPYKDEDRSKTYIELLINSLNLEYTSDYVHVEVPLLEVNDRESNKKIVKMSRLDFSLQKMHPQAYGWKIAAENKMELQLDQLYVEAESCFAQKVLTIKSYIDEEVFQEQPDKNFIAQFISKKIPKHSIFNAYSSTSTQVLIKSMVISTSVFEKDRNMEVNIKGINYNDPVNEKSNFGIEQAFILRSNQENTLKKVNSAFRSSRKPADETVILTSTRSFEGFTDKHNFKRVSDIVIPFLLIQLSCQDLYYAMNVMNVWTKILSNPYYFPKGSRRKPKPAKINPNAVQFARQMNAALKYQNIFKFKLEGVQLYLLSDYLNEENNRIMDLLLDCLTLRIVTTYLVDTLSLQIRDIYIRNCLSNKAINKQSLITSIRDELKFGDDPILCMRDKKQLSSQQRNAKMDQDKQLLLFADPSVAAKQQLEPFLSFLVQSKVNLKDYKSTTRTDVTVVPIYIFYSLQFTEMINTVLSTISRLSSERISLVQESMKGQQAGLPFSQPGLAKIEDTEAREQEFQNEVMSAQQFQQVNRISARIKKLSLLAVKNSAVVCTISLAQISVKHRSEPYVKRFFFISDSLIIVDTSEEAGPQPVIISLQKSIEENYPMKGSYTSYNSEIMKHKQKKSAFFFLQLKSPEINFLKKKVLELVNFVMIMLRQVGVMPKPDQELISKPKPSPNDFPLRYKIEILMPKIRLFRSSLSKQGFKAIGQSIKVMNYIEQEKPDDEDEEAYNREESIIRGLASQYDPSQEESNFYDLNREGDEQVEFMSFEKEKKSTGQAIEKIYIKIVTFHIYGVQYWEKEFSQLFCPVLQNNQGDPVPMMEIPIINIEFFSPDMIVSIPVLEGNLYDEDYRVLIRMTEQNLSESPTLFVDTPRVQVAIHVSFRTSFIIDQCNLSINILEENVAKFSQKLKKKIILKLDYLSGKNELWTNNQILTELSIRSMELITGNQVKIISRLNEEHFSELPQIPKSTAVTDMNEHPEFAEMEKESKKLLNQLLQNQTDKVQIFREEGRESFDEDESGNANKSTTEKICQWMKGMVKKCGKCCKCCKTKRQEETQDNIMGNVLKMNEKNQKTELNNSRIELGNNQNKNRTACMIYKFEEILEFQHQINEEIIETKKKQPNMVYLYFVIRPNGEKQMYMLAKKMEVLLQNSKGLIGLSKFFARPYSISDVPEHVRRYKFNNNKPFKMLIEVDDALAEIRAENQEGKMERISVLCDLIYDSENRGDTTIGPGISRLRVESVAKILFMSDKFKTITDLSDSFKLIFLSENKIPYGEDQRNQTKQQILLKPHEKQDWNISFFIPAFALKALNRIIMFNFYKIHNEDEAHFQQEKRQEEAKDVLEMGASPRQQQLRKPKSLNERIASSKERENHLTVPRKKVSENQQDSENDRAIKEYQREKMNKPLVQAVAKQMHMIRSLYIPEITFEIESKQESSFIKSKISDIKLSQVYINNKNYKRSTRNALATLGVNYWNLKLGVYEPCIEPWRFRMEQDVYQRDNLSSSNLKISSEIDSWKIDEQYVNDLNVNISIALYQTYKELMIVYEQEDFDENENCFDLTTFNTYNYDVLFDRNKKVEKGVVKKDNNFPKKLMKYFTRVFKTEGQSLKKYLKEGNKAYFNPPSIKLYLYHSYFDHFRRKKCLSYRTPYRIFNSTNVDLVFWFLSPKDNLKWNVVVRMFEYYAVPKYIYSSDFLVHISDELQKPPEDGAAYVSVKYLIQMRAKIKDFKKITQESVVWKNIFKYSSAQTEKYIDYRDMIIRVGKRFFTAVNVYSKHEPREEQMDEKYDDSLRFYDAYCILQSPIIIDNYSYLDLRIKVDNRASVVIPKNQRIEINESLNEIVSDTAIEVENDSLHEERRILWENYGDTEKTIEIQKLQSIKMIISRETTSSCLIKIFAEWNISNFTSESFSLKNSEKLLLIDKYSFNCLSNVSSKGIDICIVNQEKHSKSIKPTNIADVITLAKKRRPNKEGPYTVEKHNQLIRSKRSYKRSQCCGCLSQSDDIYEHIDFVINSKEDPIEPLRCQKIEFRYRYLIRNRTSSLIKLCQHQASFVIAELPPKTSLDKTDDPAYIFYYDFIPQDYFIEIEMYDAGSKGLKKLESCKFRLDQFPGSTFVIKIKKEGSGGEVQKYEDRFHYLQFEIKKMEEETLIQIMNADFSDFPIYLDNLTDYQIKILEGEDEIILRPQHRIPFAWSHLASEDYKLEVSIEGADSKQMYLFNNKSAFEPLKIMDKNIKKKKIRKDLYLQQNCYVVYEYMGISTVCLVVLNLFNNKLVIHNKEHNINYEFDMEEIQKIGPLASKIELYFQNSDMLEIMPPSKSIKKWIENLQQCTNANVVDKIFFTIESYNNSRIFFFRTIGEEQFESSKQQYSIAHLNVSLISSQPEEVILIYCGNVSYIQHDKQNKLNYKELEVSESEKIITIKKIKVSNQTKDAVNPVVISQIKKSNYPFIELRLTRQKLHLSSEAKNMFTSEKQLQLKQEEEKIAHYKEITFFMDEAEVMVEAALFLKMFGLKKNYDHVTNQYAVGAKMSEKDQELLLSNQGYLRQVQLVNIEEGSEEKNNPQVYINYLEIKPIKMTVSVYLQHNSEENVKMNIISIVRYIPFGIENAILQMQSYQFFHVFYNMNQLKKQLIKYYTKQAWNQIYKNAGSYDMFVPIQLLGGVGNGVKQIFYDPIYELVKRKQIKAVGKTFCEGLLSFIAFLIGFFFKIINLAFKILAVFTFDREYQTKRESFRKQIFKSPLEGALLGGKNFLNVFKSVFTNFANIPKVYGGYFIFGYIFGLLVCILKIIPWSIKLVVSMYDWIYVIGLGFVNWGYYEESAMKARSRPRRTFYHKQIIAYNYLHSLGNEIILKNQLQEVENEEIYFVKSIEGKDDANYLILSNYRIIHSYFKLGGMQEIKLYQLLEISSRFQPNKNDYLMTIQLKIPNIHKILLLISYNIMKYKLNFNSLMDISNFLKKLKYLCLHQHLDVKFDESKQIHREISENELVLAECLENNFMIKEREIQEEEVVRERNRWRKPHNFSTTHT